jgi:hypothetical protein
MELLALGLLNFPPMRPNCHISERVKGCCDVCGNWPNRLHMPEELHGWYCAACCPACKADAVAQQQPQAEQQPQEHDQAA